MFIIAFMFIIAGHGFGRKDEYSFAVWYSAESILYLLAQDAYNTDIGKRIKEVHTMQYATLSNDVELPMIGYGTFMIKDSAL